MRCLFSSAWMMAAASAGGFSRGTMETSGPNTSFSSTPPGLSLDTTGVPPTSHVLDLANVMRDDEVRPCYPADAMLANAPDPEGDQFRVPKILEE